MKVSGGLTITDIIFDSLDSIIDMDENESCMSNEMNCCMVNEVSNTIENSISTQCSLSNKTKKP